jgi:hypothetical protein
MVRSTVALQQPHEVDIPPTSRFQTSAGVNVIHVSVDQYLEKILRADRWISPEMGVRRVQLAVIQLLQNLAEQSDRIVRWNEDTRIDG